MAEATTVEEPAPNGDSVITTSTWPSPPLHFSFDQSPNPYHTLHESDEDQGHDGNNGTFKFTAALHMVCAGFSAALSIVGLLSAHCVIARNEIVCQNDAYVDFYATVAWPLWSAVCFYVVASILGVTCSYWKNNCMVLAYLVTSIIASVFAAGQVVWESLGAISVQCVEVRDTKTGGLFDSDFLTHYDCSGVHLSRDSHIGSAVVGFVEFIVAIVAAVYCCRTISKQMSAQKVVIQYVNTPAMQPGPPPYAP